MRAAWVLAVPIAASLLGAWEVLRHERRAMELVELVLVWAAVEGLTRRIGGGR